MFGVFVLGYAAFEVNGLRQSQHLFEPLFTFDQFVSMHHARLRCAEQDQALRARFDPNLEAVTGEARRHLKGMNPEATNHELQSELADRRATRVREIDLLIEQEGCHASKVWTLTQLYEKRARLTIRGEE